MTKRILITVSVVCAFVACYSLESAFVSSVVGLGG